MGLLDSIQNRNRVMMTQDFSNPATAQANIQKAGQQVKDSSAKTGVGEILIQGLQKLMGND